MTTISQFTETPRVLEMRKTAQKLETSFATEMLKAAGVGKQFSNMGGGIGEEQLSSFLVEMQANAMVEAGAFGLTEALLQSLIKMDNQNGE
ncbi:chemotaxis protein chel [Donghicola sp. XS_ASV15]|uniref:chemotaxis protein chel n=1 Tax=Donghicola sp. XS_ASV15 TaxID=3241295 RepID=UPI003515E27E